VRIHRGGKRRSTADVEDSDDSRRKRRAQPLEAEWPEGIVINVNYPNCEPDAVRGIPATAQGQRDSDLLRIEDRLDTRGNAYYWVGIERRIQPPEGTDLWAVRTNFISVTPLCLDYTDRGTLDRLEAALPEAKLSGRPKAPAHEGCASAALL
jgi:5'/3'-nucleotidase SurE